jgi:malate/lactate dehydrogenase
MTRLDQNRASSLLAKKADVDVSTVTRMTIWGNHSSTQVPDFVNARIEGKPVTEKIKDRHWLEEDFFAGIQNRGSEVIKARGKSSAASAAHAVIKTMRSLLSSTPHEQLYSVGLCSDDNPYGIQEDLIFSFPCLTTENGNCQIVADLIWDSFLQNKIQATEKELLEERSIVVGGKYG